MSLSLERMRLLIRRSLKKMDDDTFTDEDVDELLNLSLWDIEERYDFETKRTSVTTELVEDQFEYSIDEAELGLSLSSIRSVSVSDSSGNRHKLARMNRDWFDENFITQSSGVPSRYMREGSVLTLYPTPGSSENGLELNLNIMEGIEDLASGVKEITGLPRNWDDMVITGAIWRGHLFIDGDLEKAVLTSNFQRGKAEDIKTDEQKKDIDSRYARLEVLWEDPS